MSSHKTVEFIMMVCNGQRICDKYNSNCLDGLKFRTMSTVDYEEEKCALRLFEKAKRLRLHITCLAVCVPKSETATAKKSPVIGRYLLRGEKTKNVVEDSTTSTNRLILLNPKYAEEDLSRDVHNWIKEKGFSFRLHTFIKGYASMSYTEVLRHILPDSVPIPAAFERIGHIVHLNLSDEQLPYGTVIGEVIRDKHPGIRTVLTKQNAITSDFRTLDLKLLVGEEDYIAHMVPEAHFGKCVALYLLSKLEGGIHFYIDYKNVYWNSRLSGERQRIVQAIPPKSLVCDVMAGVGAFSMHLGKSGCYVLANDYNPRATECIIINSKRNKVEDVVKPYNMDGRDFIRYCIETLHILDSSLFDGTGTSTTDTHHKCQSTCDEDHQQYEGSVASGIPVKRRCIKQDCRGEKQQKQPPRWVYEEVHFLLNLPQIALQFLDTFKDIYVPPCCKAVIHCYCFSDPGKYEAILKAEVQRNYAHVPEDLRLVEVRNVAPNKHMYCVEFSLKSSKKHIV